MGEPMCPFNMKDAMHCGPHCALYDYLVEKCAFVRIAYQLEQLNKTIKKGVM